MNKTYALIGLALLLAVPAVAADPPSLWHCAVFWYTLDPLPQPSVHPECINGVHPQSPP